MAMDRRTGMVFALLVGRKGAAARAVEKLAERVDAPGSTQETRRSDGEQAVMQVASAVRNGKKEWSPSHSGDFRARTLRCSATCKLVSGLASSRVAVWTNTWLLVNVWQKQQEQQHSVAIWAEALVNAHPH